MKRGRLAGNKNAAEEKLESLLPVDSHKAKRPPFSKPAKPHFKSAHGATRVAASAVNFLNTSIKPEAASAMRPSLTCAWRIRKSSQKRIDPRAVL
jgi:hypothetical protein